MANNSSSRSSADGNSTADHNHNHQRFRCIPFPTMASWTKQVGPIHPSIQREERGGGGRWRLSFVPACTADLGRGGTPSFMPRSAQFTWAWLVRGMMTEEDFVSSQQASRQASKQLPLGPFSCPHACSLTQLSSPPGGTFYY